MAKKLLFLGALIVSVFTFAQQGDGGHPKGSKTTFDLKSIDEQVFNQPNIEQLRAEDAVNDAEATGPWRFGFNNLTHLTTSNSGTWFDLPNGDKLWLVKLTCTNALTVNLTFSDVKLPEGNELFVFNPTKDYILGKFTAYHLYEGMLGTELVPGESVIVEYYVPAKNSSLESGLTISNVTHGYRTASEFHEKAFGSSGSCNYNVNCPEGAAWTNERNSVVMLVSGSNGFCSGALVNNTLNDGKPYVLTADHCYSNPASWIFRFNWQSASCPNPGSSPSFQSLSGGTLRARGTASDFCLVEITGGLVGGTVPSNCTPYFAGWDNTGTTPTSAVGIHHPSGDIKKISFENQALISTTFGSCPANSHWGVTGWDLGVTEGGSSGSPLFDQNHRIIGQLHGGASACGAPVLSDEYGKVSVSWNPAGSANSGQLKFWLDPNSAGAGFVNGYDPSGSSSVALDAGLNNPQGVSGTYCTSTLNPQVTISNSGTSTLTSATINYGFDGMTNLTYNWSGSLAQWQTTVVTLPSATLGGGNHTFNASVSSPNGATDQNATNNVVTSSFSTVVGGVVASLALNLDCYGTETSWELTSSTGTVLFSGSGYTDSNPITVNQDFCLNYGCYNFTINDSYGDGLTGCSAANGGAGSYQITYNGLIKAEITEAQADFGNSNTQNFCIIDDSGIDELALSNAISVYPNPSNGEFVVNNNLGNIDAVEVLNIQGKVIYTTAVSASSTVIKLNTIAAGTYFVKATMCDHAVVKQIVVK
jgi:hypothetical protein